MSNPDTHVTDQPERKIYWKSLLQIEMPVCVTLARKMANAEQVLKLVPGAMIHFNMPCDKPLSLEVDDNVIARGDVVKVGDKFGLKLLAIENQKEQWLDIFANSKAKQSTKASSEQGVAPKSAQFTK